MLMRMMVKVQLMILLVLKLQPSSVEHVMLMIT